MNSTFLSEQNIDNLYSYINTEIIKTTKYNLDNDVQNKKIVRKLAKTINKKKNNEVQNMNLNDFNELVISKSVPFIQDLIKQKKIGNVSNKSTSIASLRKNGSNNFGNANNNKMAKCQ